MTPSRSRDYGLVLLASVLWGTSFPGSKLTVGTVDPLFLTFARMAIGALLGLTVLAATRRLDLHMFREAMTRLKVVGILIGTFGVVVVATKLDPASLSGGQFAGDVLVFIAGVVWAFYVVGAKKMVDR